MFLQFVQVAAGFMFLAVWVMVVRIIVTDVP